MASVFSSNDRQAFVATYIKESFRFAHALASLEIFDVAELAAMAERLPDPAYYSEARNSIADGWKHTGDRRDPVARALETVAQTDSLVLLRHCEKDPKHGQVFRRLMDDIIDEVGEPFRQDVEAGRATIVISSPHRVTSYHIDAEVNFLLQVRGRKLLYAFDPNDGTVLTDEELEAFYGGDLDAARYKTERQSDAQTFTLEPGTGVHLPLHAPHWAQNLDDVSIGVSLNFNLRSAARLAKVYKVNRGLRRVGLHPAAPGRSAWQDELKVAAFLGLAQGRALVKSRFSRERAT